MEGGRVGVVLAAGLGSRLAAGDPAQLKPLTPVAGVPLFCRTLRSLQRAGCTRAVVVVGFRGEELAETIRRGWDGALPLEFVENPHWRRQNGVSVLAAAERVGDEFILTMADHVLDDAMMDLARAHRPAAGGATLLVDRRIAQIFDLDDATKVALDGDRIVRIGKGLDRYDAVDTGVFVCTRGLLDALAEVLAERGDASLSDGIGRLAAAGRMGALDIGDAFWQDVDTPEMLAHAEAVLRARGG